MTNKEKPQQTTSETSFKTDEEDSSKTVRMWKSTVIRINNSWDNECWVAGSNFA